MKKYIRWIFLAGIVLIVLLGYIDYLTGDYSMNMFYLVVIFAVTFFTNKYYGIVCATEAVMAEAMADYYVHKGFVFEMIYYWNWMSDLVIFVGLCIATSFVKRIVERDCKNL
jgi:hypothetical protein